MSELRRRGRRPFAVFGVSILVFSLLPNQIGFQDLGALIARRPEVAERWHKHIIASPFGTLHAAMFSMPRPIGTAIPAPPLYALASVDPNEITGALGREPLGDPGAPMQFPTVNRKKKGDAMALRSREPLPLLAPLPPSVTLPVAEPPAEPQAGNDETTTLEQADTAARFDDYNEYALPVPFDLLSQTPDVELPYVDLSPTDFAALGRGVENESGSARLYFGIDPMSTIQEAISPRRSGEAPVVMVPRGAGDPDIKQSALAVPRADDVQKSGETIAGKGEVTGEGRRPMSPAERLKLSGTARAKAEKCLANAVYFEARGEPVRGQIAVAQVVMNRVFSPFYPKDVCGVVYQNAHRHLACQFTFACDGIPDVVTEPDAWIRAKRISADMLDGKLWMPEVAKSTHYHAYWVHPSWVGEMKRILKLGVHTFYRPRNWGDGSEEPKWGDAKNTTELAAKLEAAQ